MDQNNQIDVTQIGASGTPQISGQNYTDLYNALQNNLQSAVQTQLQNIGQAATNKGAMLGTPTPTMGISSYDYNRLVGPQLAATQAQENLTGAKLAAQQTLKNLLADAQYNLEQAQRRRNARNYAKAVSGGSGGGGPKATVTGVESTSDPQKTLPYVDGQSVIGISEKDAEGKTGVITITAEPPVEDHPLTGEHTETDLNKAPITTNNPFLWVLPGFTSGENWS